VECYTYVFGEETDGTSNVLFPYTKKHSPYCGVTGTRLFPRDYSMVPDEKGAKDKIVVLVTHAPIDFEAFNAKITASKGANYEEKMKNLMGASSNQNLAFSGSEIVSFSKSSSNKDPFYFVIGINK